MGLQDIAGVLSRYFVIGFFLPAFFTLMALSLVLSHMPRALERHHEGVRVLIVGGVALLAGLLLSGLRYLIHTGFEGTFLVPRPGSRASRFVAPLTKLVLLRQTAIFNRRMRDRDSSDDPVRQQQAAWHLDRRFPSASRLLPTAYGNTSRATTDYAWSRWRLDLNAVGDRVMPLTNDRERDLYVDARTDLAFFVNATLGSLVVLALLIADEIAYHPLPALAAPFVDLGILVLADLFYRQAVSALERVGRIERASLDLHRYELYDKLGVRRPRSFTEERETIARAVNRCLLWGHALPDELAAEASELQFADDAGTVRRADRALRAPEVKDAGAGPRSALGRALATIVTLTGWSRARRRRRT